MLSRVANRLYWIARYLERAEVTARLCGAYSHLILDIPRGSVLGWDTLITTIDGEPAFNNHYQNSNERNILKFMLADTDNIGSVRASITAARENVRTTRDVLPEELWELINEFHLYVDEWAEKSVARRHRFNFLEEVVSRTQEINGLIESAVSRDHAYSFLKLGRLIERTDMVSRTVDAATSAILNHDSEEVPDLTLLWISLLKAVSANSAYRREIGPVVDASEIVNFLFKNESFPRSMLYCTVDMQQVLKHLNNTQAVAAQLDNIAPMLREFDAEQNDLRELHLYIDRVQEKLIDLDSAINDTWFAPPSL